MRIIIAGGRDFNDYELLKNKCFNIIQNIAGRNTEKKYTAEGFEYIEPVDKNYEIVCGKAPGADTLGEKFGKEYGFKIKYFPADWDNVSVGICKIKINKFGKPYNVLAGINRNLEMARYAQEDNGILIAFWNGKSTGTRNMINLAKEHGLKVFVINY